MIIISCYTGGIQYEIWRRLMMFDSIPILEGYKTLEKLDSDDDKFMCLVESADGHRRILKVFQKTYKYPIYERLSKLVHENMPAIHGVFLREDCFCVLEDYVEGRTLQEILETDGVFDKRTAIGIISQLCDVLMYLHNQPSAIIHRDIKPANIILTGDGTVKLLDFDIAREHRYAAAMDTEVVGTRHFAPPEQYGFSQSDQRTDIYSLGVLLTVLLTNTYDAQRIKSLRIKAMEKIKSNRKRESQMKRKILCTLLVTLLILGLASPAAFAANVESSLPFADVPANEWYYPYVQFVFERDIMQGLTGTTFAPYNMLTRAQVVALLFRTHNERIATADDSRDNPFTDVGDTWYAPYVTWAYNNGIAGGPGGGIFLPNDNVTRQEFATVLFRYADELTDFDTTIRTGAGWDAFIDRGQIASWALDALTWANYHGFVGGTTSTTINPSGTANRAQAAAMLTRYVRAVEDACDIVPEFITIAGVQIPTSISFLTLDAERGILMGYGLWNHEPGGYRYPWIEMDLQLTDRCIRPLRHMTNLVSLTIRDFGEGITDISPIAGLTNLRSLGLRLNNISDITAITGMTDMGHLILSDNNISDITPLAGMPDLHFVNLWNNNISDISPLAGLRNLDWLGLGGNPITDWSPVDHVERVGGRP